MLIRLNTIHHPTTIDEAIHLLTERNTRPLYGGMALHRESPTHVTAVVDLSKLKLDRHRVFDAGFSLGSMMTLEKARQTCLELVEKIPNAGFMAEMLKLEAPINQRNTTTIGDVLVEKRPNSILLTAFTALDAQVDANGWPRFIHDWLTAPEREVKQALITEVAMEKGSVTARHAFEKVARTPADDPIVGAMAYLDRDADGKLHDVRLALCGVADHPIPLGAVDEILIESNGDVDRALSALKLAPPNDHWGSSEYRVEMAKILIRRALSQI
ncbi:MAG: FAD binding domain-containing protein [Chloroflexi bacterium]|nr:FAD binding domain-containing protein [Chloroflexota bacterium]